ncbi:MAG TPA: hypothetical protein VMZ69_01700, partial [Saprospiraceae bacterium]|nr:hypothetical protein [Saprospiraceae bacterium]
MKDENPFKEKLYHHTLPVSEVLWSRIELQLPVQREKRKFPFFLFALATILLMAAVILYLANRNDSQLEEKINPDNKTNPSPYTPSTEPTSEV